MLPIKNTGDKSLLEQEYFLAKCIKEMEDVKIGEIRLIHRMMCALEYWEPQYLYATADEEIKETDWCLYNKNHNSKNPIWELFQCGKIESEEMHPISEGKLLLWLRKIVTTSDPELVRYIHREDSANNPCPDPVPKIAKAFIKLYVNRGGVDTALVDYELTQKAKNDLISGKLLKAFHSHMIPKVNLDQTVTIHLIGEKMEYGRAQVEDLLLEYREYAWKNGLTLKDLTAWMRTNL